MTAPEFLSWAEARARVLAAVRPLAPIDMPLDALPGRALAERVAAPYALPPFANSAMDGYALRAGDVAAAPIELPVVMVLAAGHGAAGPLPPGTAARIMTGAEIPDGANAVVPFEEAERIDAGEGERVRLIAPARAGAHIRPAGADIAAGEEALAAGRELSAHDVALLAALGFDRARARPRPRAAVISTGDELLPAGAPPAPGRIHDSNRPMLCALAREAGCEVVLDAHAGDDPARVTAAIRGALERAQVVFTIGGVSAGDFDPVKQSLSAIGGIHLWRVAMRPGKPQAFGTSGGRLFFGLPGNPASVACVFETLARPALRALQGFKSIDRPRIEVRAAAPIASKAGRTDFIRVTLAREAGTWLATPAGAQTSGHLTPQSRAHALAVIPEALDQAQAGAALEALLLRWPEDTRRT